MKPISIEAGKILDKLIAEAGPEGYVKIDTTEGAFMPVVIEKRWDAEAGPVWSVAHYYEQNGDLMSDPFMEFLRDEVSGRYYPTYFEMHGVFARAEESILFECGEIKGYRKKMQSDHAAFASQWMKNIKAQQREVFKKVKVS